MNKININDGIKFECQGSGNCCVSRGSYGYVYLSKKDLKKLSKYFNLSKKEFVLQFCQTTDGYIHLVEKNNLNGKCIFLNKNRCTVYKSRPTQCRTWPFWNENMNPKIWNKEISIYCPGIGKGKKINSQTIKKFLKEDYENDKSIIKNTINPLK
tara:strand:- start:5 stop:466 length:462 start_codon:yes stop_codon:yes gene_type:complete